MDLSPPFKSDRLEYHEEGIKYRIEICEAKVGVCNTFPTEETKSLEKKTLKILVRASNPAADIIDRREHYSIQIIETTFLENTLV